MSQIGFFYNMNRCTGCKTCQIACKDKNNLDIGLIYRHAENYEMGTYPSVRSFCYSFSCNHCAAPACITACSNDAIYREEDGTVIIDQELCEGCQECITACPYSVPVYHPATGKTNKCDACFELRAHGEEPACASGCPGRALYFGELEELEKTHGKGMELVDEFPVLGSSKMTKPSILIAIKECAKEEEVRPSLF